LCWSHDARTDSPETSASFHRDRLSVTVFAMMYETQPTNLQWLPVVVVMRLRLDVATDFARLSLKTTVSHRVRDDCASTCFSWVSLTILLRTSLHSGLAFRSLMSQAIVLAVVRSLLLTVRLDVLLRARLAFPEVAVSHHRMLVEEAQRLSSLALEARLVALQHGKPVFVREPG
jgi:hypothetical protein